MSHRVGSSVRVETTDAPVQTGACEAWHSSQTAHQWWDAHGWEYRLARTWLTERADIITRPTHACTTVGQMVLVLMMYNVALVLMMYNVALVLMMYI